jgi:hypothetical protein
MDRLGAIFTFLVGSGLLAACVYPLDDPWRGEYGGGGGPAGSTSPADADTNDGGSLPTTPDSAAACPALASLVSGVPAPIATIAGANPGALVTDGTALYVAPYEVGAVTRVSLADCSTTALNPIAGNGVAIDATRVYSASPLGGDEPQGLILACPKTGCASGYTTLASGASNVSWLAVDGANLYYTTQGAAGSLVKLPLAGGPATTLATGGPAWDLAVGGDRIAYIGALDTSGGAGLLLAIPTTGGTPTALFGATGGNGVWSVVADEQNAYFSTTDGVVGQVPLSGGTATTLATDQGNGAAIAVDDANVYWGALPTASSEGPVSWIRRAPKGGGAVSTLATFQGGSVAGITAGADRVVYFTANSTVYALAAE